MRAVIGVVLQQLVLILLLSMLSVLVSVSVSVISFRVVSVIARSVNHCVEKGVLYLGVCIPPYMLGFGTNRMCTHIFYLPRCIFVNSVNIVSMLLLLVFTSVLSDSVVNYAINSFFLSVVLMSVIPMVLVSGGRIVSGVDVVSISAGGILRVSVTVQSCQV